jgi:thioredoxin 1
MTTKKALVIVGVLLGGVCLLVALFAAAVAGVVFYTIGNSEAAETAKSYLRANERLKRDIGEVRDFGFFVTGDIKTRDAAGTALLGLKAVGERKTVNTSVEMIYRAGREWRVVEAYYDTDAGERVYLTRNFEEEAGAPPGDAGSAEGGVSVGDEARPGGDASGSGATAGEFDEEGFAAEVLRAEWPVLVVVGSPSSLASVELEKTLEQLAPKYEESVALVRYDLSEQPAVLQRFNVAAVPTVIIFKGGEERGRLAGEISRQELTQLIGKYLEP